MTGRNRMLALAAVLTDAPKPSPHCLTFRLGVGPRFVRVAFNPLGERAVEWLRKLCFRELTEQEFFGKVVPEARQRSTRVSLDPPFLATDCLAIEASRASSRPTSVRVARHTLRTR